MLGFYIHIPFCRSRCAYCDFYFVVDTKSGGIRGEFMAALCREIEMEAKGLEDHRADAVFFGGGTPSLLPPDDLARLLDSLARHYSLAAGSEITLEANPEDLTEDYLRGIRRAGITRLSLGWQSGDDAVLASMARPHRKKQAGEAYARAREAGFASISLDIICGYPGESEASWQASLEGAIALRPDHLSLYLLERHEGTWLDRQLSRGGLAETADDVQASRYEGACIRLEAAGLHQYEISNFARPGHASRHNLKYWSDAPYLGFGPGAHSYRYPWRRADMPDLRAYCSSLMGGHVPPRETEVLTPERHASERIMLGLRKTEGHRLSAADAEFLKACEDGLKKMREAGLLEREGEWIRLTAGGRLLANEVMELLMPENPSARKKTSAAG